MISFLLFIQLFNFNDCQNRYLNKILDKGDRAKYYLVLNVRVDNKYGEIVVLNSNLYNVLKRKNKFLSNYGNYFSFVKRKISKNLAFEFSEKEIEQLQTKQIVFDSAVLKLADLGEEDFIAKYFHVEKARNYAILKSEVKPESVPTIVRSLFKWNNLLTMVEGNLVIEQLDFCETHLK